jgi:hypothetical protein
MDAFSVSTGLAINFDKSSFIPLNLDREDQSLISSILGCPMASFPQTYLGLPLSDTKLPIWAFFPLLRSLDNKVDTLSIKGASSGGRHTLTKSILSVIPSHILACIKVPKWFYKEIDNRRRSYFWAGQTSALGGQCKVAWDVVYISIEEGGLDIKNLETQNIYLLLKFIHKLHTSNNRSWVKWIRASIYQGNKRLGDKVSSCTNS